MVGFCEQRGGRQGMGDSLGFCDTGWLDADHSLRLCEEIGGMSSAPPCPAGLVLVFITATDLI